MVCYLIPAPEHSFKQATRLILVDPEGPLEPRNHWEKTSHSLLVGAILHVLYAEPDKTSVANFLSDPRRTINTTLKVMMTTVHLGLSGPTRAA